MVAAVRVLQCLVKQIERHLVIGNNPLNQFDARPGLRELDRLMRERAGLAPAPVPVPLHRMGAAKMAAMTALPRCTMPGCPVRYRAGPDRVCAMHAEDGDTLTARMTAFAELSAIPERGGRDGGDGDGGDGDGGDGHRRPVCDHPPGQR